MTGIPDKPHYVPDIGETWTWEPDAPHARTSLRVTGIKWNGEEWWIEAEKPDGQRCWNDFGRWVEAAVMVANKDESIWPPDDSAGTEPLVYGCSSVDKEFPHEPHIWEFGNPKLTYRCPGWAVDDAASEPVESTMTVRYSCDTCGWTAYRGIHPKDCPGSLATTVVELPPYDDAATDVRCPKCERLVDTDVNLCERCGHTFTLPAPVALDPPNTTRV